jgi:hypothetical protein
MPWRESVPRHRNHTKCLKKLITLKVNSEWVHTGRPDVKKLKFCDSHSGLSCKVNNCIRTEEKTGQRLNELSLSCVILHLCDI